MQTQPIGFLGLGASVPAQVLSNADLEKMVDTSDEWIVSRTGIRERRICGPDENTTTLAIEAARRAVADARLDPNQIDLIICCTFTPDALCPSTACRVQAALGISRPIPAFDISAACSGFIYGCATAAAFISAGTARHVLVIGAEAMSKFLDYHDRNTCVIFGDGAGAVVLGPVGEGRGLVGQCLGADGTGADMITLKTHGKRQPLNAECALNGREYLAMQGNEVFKFATRILGTAVEEALASNGNGLRPKDLELIIPHQANVRIIESAARKLGVPLDRFVINIGKYGNTSAATVPLAMVDAREDGRLKPGTLFAIVAFGGGLTYAASVWRW